MPSRFGASSVPFIACLALLAAEILQILAYAAPYWAYSDNDVVDGRTYTGYFGLWRYAKCQASFQIRCSQWDFSASTEPWRDAVRAMESIAIILVAIPLIILPVYIYVALGLYYRCIMGSMALFTIVAVVCNVIGVVIHGVQIGMSNNWRLGWCLIVCIVGGALALVGFVVLLIATVNKPVFVADRYYPSGLYVDPDRNKLYAVEHVPPLYDNRAKVNVAADLQD